MPRELTRIFSDLHYGDLASRIGSLGHLRPLLEGVDHLVLNGDTLDTRPGAVPAHTARCRAEVLAFFPAETPRATLLTGNHDADLTDDHCLDLAGGRVFATHGDIFYDDLVPWSRDVPSIRPQITAGLAALPPAARDTLAARFAVWRQVAAAIPQRHQSETRGLRYLQNFARDTIWPPARAWRILRTWRREATVATAFARTHRPAAKFVLIGHTHRPGVVQAPGGVHVINTGSFCRPLGGWLADVTADRLVVRRIAVRRGEFRPGDVVAEFSLD